MESLEPRLLLTAGGSQDPVLLLDDVLATFTDANPQSVAEHFSLVVQWGDGSLNTSADRDSYDYPYVWITEDANTHTFQVRGRHGFPTPGAYEIAVRVLEDEHSRAAATSSGKKRGQVHFRRRDG